MLKGVSIRLPNYAKGSPCGKCNHRFDYCHSSCKEYLDWKKYQDEIREKVKADRMKNADIYRFHFRNYKPSKK